MSKKYYQGLSEFHCYATRVGTSTMRLWVGTLQRDMDMPQLARVRVTDASSQQVFLQNIQVADWDRPFPDAGKDRFYRTVEVTGLRPERKYRAFFERQLPSDHSWQIMRSATVKTLPLRLPMQGKKPFTIGLGSCFWPDRDGGRVGTAYRGLYENPRDPNDSPDITCLTGDQVYLDIGFDSRSRVLKEIRRRIASDYAKHWEGLSDVLTRGATYMLPDDHEWYNGYPDPDPKNPYLSALQDTAVRNVWEKSARHGIRNVQQCPVVETMDFGGDLSICFADLRSYRKKNLGGLMNGTDFQTLIDWAESLSSPGVLVSPQPLIVSPNKSEANLLAYTEDYCRLLKALAHTGNDVVVLSGDVHFGRVVSVPLGTNGATLYEVVSSPLSNLTYLDGLFATNKNRNLPKRFPDNKAFKHPQGKQHLQGWTAKDVNHYLDANKDNRYDIEPKSSWNRIVYPRARTREHFMTIGFSRLANGKGVSMTVRGWLVRETDRYKARQTVLPKRAFSFKQSLKKKA